MKKLDGGIMNEKHVSIAVLDTYVDTSCEIFKDITIHISHKYDGSKIETESDGHGTAVCSVLAKFCKNAEITVYPLFKSIDDELSIEVIITCLEEIAASSHFDVINMSLGVTALNGSELNRLEAVCKKIVEAGTVIIAAFDNGGMMSYPAALSNVLGVDTSPNIKTHYEYEIVYNSPVNIRGCSLPQRVIWGKGKYLLVSGSSFVAPYISAIVANLILDGASNIREIMRGLAKKSCKRSLVKNCKIQQEKLFEIKKAIAFPFNKEIHSLVAFSHMLSFDLIGVYDIKHSMRVNRYASEIMDREIKKDYIIKNIDFLDWNEDFDTIILGHIDEIVRIIGGNIAEKIFCKAKAYNKNIYAFDDAIIKYNSNYISNENIFVPSVKNIQYPKQNLGKMWYINTPVLGVFGTRSKQGKFTVQQYIREHLSQAGYKVGYLATEPSGYLLQAQNVFPYGYNSTVDIPVEKIAATVNEMLHSIDMLQYDIILTGGQSGVVPYDYYNLNNLLIPQVGFLYGTNPDAVILCICADDDIDYVKRTISFIESACNTDVLGAVLFPYKYEPYASGFFHKVSLKKDWNAYSNLANYLSEELSLPVYVYSENSFHKCVKDIIYFLSE